jgi:F-box protein, helicase, 18
MEKLGTLNLTEEQQEIIKSTGDIKINAVAGSGKTTTIIQYAASRPKNARILYLAFNKSVRLEATKRFSELGLNNVQVETAHSLAFKHIVARSSYQVSQSGYKIYDIAGILGLQSNGEMHGEYILANHINKFITYFCNSAAEKVQDLNYLDIVSDDKARSFVENLYPHIEKGARLMLGKMYNREIEITHDFYLKMFQLSQPVLSYDYILFDEGQDASPAMLDIFLKQKAIKVIVGDTHQQIYSWRHAVNSLGKVNFESYNLSTSFRFHQDIANLSAEVLIWKKHLQDFKPVAITGRGKPPKIKSKATIARTNLGLLLKAITFITENKNAKHLYFEGNINSYTYADEGASLYDVLSLFNNNHSRIRDKLIASMKNMDDLEDYIEKTEDMQLSMMVEVVKEYENEIPSLLKSLKDKHVGDKERDKAEMIFSTVHRAKGMEYDTVQLAEDFVTEDKLEKLKKEKESGEEINVAKWNEEINLLYVAITRAKGMLRIPESLLPKDFPKSPHIEIIKSKKKSNLDDEVMWFDKGSRNKYLEKRKDIKTKKEVKAYSVGEKRLAHKNAYERWTPESDAELKLMYNKGTRIKLIAEHFGRNEGAIMSRLKKMGCVDY